LIAIGFDPFPSQILAAPKRGGTHVVGKVTGLGEFSTIFFGQFFENFKSRPNLLAANFPR
jgi:hypothetical protein